MEKWTIMVGMLGQPPIHQQEIEVEEDALPDDVEPLASIREQLEEGAPLMEFAGPNGEQIWVKPAPGWGVIAIPTETLKRLQNPDQTGPTPNPAPTPNPKPAPGPGKRRRRK